jgi:transposase
MSGYSEDLRTRIVSAVEGGMSKAQAARTFSVSLSSVKRYVNNKAERAESLALRRRDPALLRSSTRRRISYSKTTSESAPTSSSRTAVST